MKLADVCRSMEQWAPLAWQESYDNAGLLVGDPATEVTGVLISLDCTEEVVDEAIQKGCNVIISHHPIVFKGLKSLTGKNYVERTVIKAIQHSVALYASHTNLDHAPKGVSYHLAQQLGVKGKVLLPAENALKQISYYVPIAQQEEVRNALHAAGAGNIGEYAECSFAAEGLGRFTPSAEANPVIGLQGMATEVQEVKVDMIFPSHLESSIISTLKKVHPYEEVAYFIHSLANRWSEVGAGFIGELSEAMSGKDFIQFVKKSLGLSAIRHTPLLKKEIKKVALCGGAGSFLIPEAKRQGADVFLTGDLKYHEFFDGENTCMLCDIGHYESEVMIKDAIHAYLSNIFSNFAVLKSETLTNPVRYA
ncbi:Nif3-like dinuclear metal center hexameric protein [Cytophagaceae bacterium 50C-KIRBA]|uniref:GTP cyclohydrolase 1 type 2 homolog n=1 Tax=Aquirufa beregesia TaxID=2516556 RepID=A0ABX0EY91_9BACT|nr:Nif3-like dinuclear metal center hexameric protein [Aquirufa beregesia]NGZ44271.1 Nif3-like dinuclear metal center hexameric protein [Aquirufa beregesia]